MLLPVLFTYIMLESFRLKGEKNTFLVPACCRGLC